jgi:D-alanyl-lipoteichoic acid acyltransferase DltB (MBOAT superfamily)
MNFSSVEFWLLLLISVPLYYILSSNKSWILLLIVSLIFYIVNGIFITFILFFAIITDYYFAILISKYKKHGRKILFLSIFLSVCILLSFKYINLLSDISYYLFNLRISDKIFLAGYVIPIGISFYTF